MKLSPKMSSPRKKLGGGSSKKLKQKSSEQKNTPFETIGGVYTTSAFLNTTTGNSSRELDDNDEEDGDGVVPAVSPLSPPAAEEAGSSPDIKSNTANKKETTVSRTSYLYMTDVAIRLREGLDIRDRSHRLKTYKSCFIARDAVDYMIKHKLCDTRNEAVELGIRLQSALGLWHHVCDDHEFSDDYLFFRFVSDEEYNMDGDDDNDQASKRSLNKKKSSSKIPGPPPLELRETVEGSVRGILSASQRSSNTLSSGIDLWMSSGLDDHHANAPKIVARRSIKLEMANNIQLGSAEMLGHVLMRSRMSLPDSKGGFKSFSILINEERTKKGIAPLARSHPLDEFARKHARDMADSIQLYHCNPLDLQEAYGQEHESRRFGENIVKGSTVQTIWESMKHKSLSDINNIQDRRFTHLGVGTAKGEDGMLYVCQVFRGQ